MKFYIVRHHHRHGVTVWPARSRDAGALDIRAVIAKIDDWEGGTPEEGYEDGRSDEWLAIDGPFTVDEIEIY